MAIIETIGKKFIELKFDKNSGDFWEMVTPNLIRSIRLTSKPNKLVYEKDYVAFYENEGNKPNIFFLTSEAKATFFHGNQSFKIGIKDFF